MRPENKDLTTITELDTRLRTVLGEHAAGLGSDTLAALAQLESAIRKVRQEAAGDIPGERTGPSIVRVLEHYGDTVTGTVAQAIQQDDIRQDSDVRGQALLHPDNSPKLTAVIRLRVTPRPEFPDGRATWFVRNRNRRLLNGAMLDAGASPDRPPAPGAQITLTCKGWRNVPPGGRLRLTSVAYQSPRGEKTSAVTEPAPSVVYAWRRFQQQPDEWW